MTKDQHEARAKGLLALVGTGAGAMLLFWFVFGVFSRAAEEKAPGISHAGEILLSIGAIPLVGMVILILYHSIKSGSSDVDSGADAAIRNRNREIEEAVRANIDANS